MEIVHYSVEMPSIWFRSAILRDLDLLKRTRVRAEANTSDGELFIICVVVFTDVATGSGRVFEQL